MSQLLKISLAVAIGLSVSSPLSGDESSLGPRHGVLLLRNGEMVEGDVLLSGDRYDVGVAGGQIHIKRSEVEYFGRSVIDCYEQRRSHAEPGKVQENLELAEWCLRQQLYEQAALALADAVDADPQHPRIALLERRLKFALEQPLGNGRQGYPARRFSLDPRLGSHDRGFASRLRRDVYHVDSAGADESLFDGRLPWATERYPAQAAPGFRCPNAQSSSNAAQLVLGAVAGRSRAAR